METKVKGDKIKEGSIPLSALSNEVKDKIENAGGGADWNAQQGEAGYIENKPFYKNDILIYYNNSIAYGNPFIYTLKILSPIIINWEDADGAKFETILNESNNYTAVVDGYDCTLDASVDKNTLILTVKETYGISIYNIYITQREIKELDEQYIPDTIARKSDIPVPIIINYNTIKDAANSEVNTISEQTWLKYIANDTYKNYDWIIQRDGIKYNCTVIPDYDNEHIQILYFTRNEIEGTSGPLGNAIMKYSGLRIKLLPYTENTYLIYKISNGGSLETREFVFGEDYNKNAYLIAAAQMSGIDTIDCKWVYTTKADDNITVNGQYFHIENSITNVDAIFSVKDKSLTYVDGNGLINKVTFADNGRYDISKNNPDIPDTVVKTTPQSLSDDDKNQALANLGIDPVVWKYICNPCIIKYGEKVPEELIGEYSDDVGSSGGYYLKYPNLAMYKIIFTDNRIDSEYGEASVIITPSGISEYGVELTDIHISKDYGVYTGDAHINENKNWASM